MAGLVLIEPTDLYNLLNQGFTYPRVSDPCYLLLLDARDKNDYIESHIITAKRTPKDENNQFTIPFDSELDCKQHVVVYDGNCSNLTSGGAAVACASIMWQMGSRNPVHVLRGGYETFSALYPFLRTQKIIYMPREVDEIQTYPIEVLPGFLYLGNWRHGNMPYIQKDVKIRTHINCCQAEGTFFTKNTTQCAGLLHLSLDDEPDADIYSAFQSACTLIEESRNNGNVVLVFSQRGISRSAAIVIAYLMFADKISLKAAYEHVLHCNQQMRPNQGFLKQLLRWEQDVLAHKTTNIELLAI